MTPGSDARQLRAALAGAPDAAVTRVVAQLDALPVRGDADALIEHIRPRLRRLRPPRPLRLPRLLFLPLDAVLVAPCEWRRGMLEVPRSAILPVSGAVAAALGPLAAEIETAGMRGVCGDARLTAELGARLWPAAAALDLPVPPPGWTLAGLPEDAARPVLALCVAVWRHAPALWAALHEEGPPMALLRGALGPLAGEGLGPLEAGMRLLLRNATAPGDVVSAAASLLPSVRPAAERALRSAVAQDVEEMGCAEPAALAEAASAFLRRLENLEAEGAPALRDARRRDLVPVRRDAASLCRDRFAAALEEALIAPATRAHAADAVPDEVVLALEGTARDLRRLETAGRRIGAEAEFDRLLRGASVRLASLAERPGGLGMVDLARLVEILAGSEAAATLLR